MPTLTVKAGDQHGLLGDLVEGPGRVPGHQQRRGMGQLAHRPSAGVGFIGEQVGEVRVALLEGLAHLLPDQRIARGLFCCAGNAAVGAVGRSEIMTVSKTVLTCLFTLCRHCIGKKYYPSNTG